MTSQPESPAYPKLCDLCGHQIESVDDLDWHGYGNCVEITDEMWAEWEKEAEAKCDQCGAAVKLPNELCADCKGGAQ